MSLLSSPNENAAGDIIDVALGDRSYKIHVGSSLLAYTPTLVPFDLKGRSLFILTDENVNKPYGGSLYEILKSAGPASVQMLALAPGEQTKSFENLQRVLAWMLDHGLNRDSVLFAVGGGVIGDLGGFAAAIAMRGIPYVQIPTTLLAQVDSSVGGKTAIDVPQGKNLVGAFHQPAVVVIDTDVLDTLPRREVLAGYAEVVKYALINDKEFFFWLEKEAENVCKLKTEGLIRAIKTSCEKKAEIVSQDEKEAGQRALLNLGHTFGHAMEQIAGYDGRILHGEAVSVGMVLAHQLSARMGLCPDTDSFRVQKHLSGLGLPTKIRDLDCDSFTADNIVQAMQTDKKMTIDGLNFVLTKGIGQAFTSKNVQPDDVKSVITDSITS